MARTARIMFFFVIFGCFVGKTSEVRDKPAARGGAKLCRELCRELCRNQLEPDSPTILAPAIRRGPRVVAKIQQLVSGRRFSKDSERLPARFGERFIFSLHNSVRKRYHVFHCHRAYLFCLSPSRHIFLGLPGRLKVLASHLNLNY
jgi:hypothetical protein